MVDTSRQSEHDAVQKTLLSSYSNPLIKEARERQDHVLTMRYRGQSLAIADVGCGDGYHGSIFGPSCVLYHGFEISPDIAALARERWHKDGLTHAEVFVGDVMEATVRAETYDVVFCLYFTPGNFRDPSDDLSIYTDAYLDENPAFIAIVTRFLAAMKPGGAMFLTIYKDVPEAEAAQRDFYVNTGQHVVTPKGSRFVATGEGFWSVRWTRDSILSNLRACDVSDEHVTLHDLNAIACLVEITKPAATGGQ